MWWHGGSTQKYDLNIPVQLKLTKNKSLLMVQLTQDKSFEQIQYITKKAYLSKHKKKLDMLVNY